MNKTLLIFIQSKTIDVYVNVLTHCINHEYVVDIFFAGDIVAAEREYELVDFIEEIQNRISQIANEHDVYQSLKDRFPKPIQFRERIIRVSYSRPQEGISEIKKKFSDLDQLIVDISTCKKRLASDITVSYMAGGIDHICHFELSDKVYSPEWGHRSKLYHDLKGISIDQYRYDDFSVSGTTKESFEKLRGQSRIIKGLLLVTAILAFAVVGLISFQQTPLAQWAALILMLAAGLGFLEDSFSIRDRFGK